MTALQELSETMCREAKEEMFEARLREDEELISWGCGATGGLETEYKL